MVRRLRRLGALIVLVLAATACSEVPTSGPVVGGNPVDPPEEQRPFIRVEAPPPQAGDEPTAIVEGFVEAMGSYAPGYETARLFLTSEASLSWDATEQITVYAGVQPTIEVVGELVHVTMNVTGTVGEDGSYVPAEPDAARELRLELVQENGEWRISNPPAGIVIAQFSFDREYEPRNVYFFDPNFEVLVPDVIYLPTNEKVATLLAQELLEGPSDWLAPAVSTAFPDGTELGVDAVPVSSRTATVELNDVAGRADPRQRELMTAQLVWTLAGLPGVDDVLVTSDGIPLPRGRQGLAPTDADMAAYDPAVLSEEAVAYAVQDGGIVSVIEDEAVPVPGPLAGLTDVSEVAVNPTASEAVAVIGDGSQLQTAPLGPGEATTSVAHGVQLTSLAWDRTGLIWAVERGGEAQGLVALRRDGARVEVVAPDLAGREVRRVAVSLDGCRIALVVEGATYVGVISRDVDTPLTVRIDGLRRFGPEGEALDVAWSEPDDVAVLAVPAGQEPAPFIVGLSGETAMVRAPRVGSTPALAAAPGRPIVVLGADGMLHEQGSGNQWRQTVAARNPTYPG